MNSFPVRISIERANGGAMKALLDRLGVKMAGYYAIELPSLPTPALVRIDIVAKDCTEQQCASIRASGLALAVERFPCLE